MPLSTLVSASSGSVAAGGSMGGGFRLGAETPTGLVAGVFTGGGESGGAVGVAGGGSCEPAAAAGEDGLKLVPGASVAVVSLGPRCLGRAVVVSAPGAATGEALRSEGEAAS